MLGISLCEKETFLKGRRSTKAALTNKTTEHVLCILLLPKKEKKGIRKRDGNERHRNKKRVFNEITHLILNLISMLLDNIDIREYVTVNRDIF